MSRGRLVSAAVLWLLAGLAGLEAQSDQLFVRPLGEVLVPLNTYQDPVSGASRPLYSPVGFGAGSVVDFKIYPWLVSFARAQYGFVPFNGGSSLQFAEADVGLGLLVGLSDRFALRLDNMAGLSELFLTGLTGTSYTAGTRLGLDYRVAPAFTLSVGGGYSAYFGSRANILSALTGELSMTYNLSSLGGEKARLTVEEVKLAPVFPSLYAYYDDHPVGTVKIVNHEDATVTDLRVWFNAGHYMDQPKVCGQYETLGRGESIVVPVKALFTDAVLNITQGLEAKGEIIVRYSYLGSERVIHEPVDFRMHHRNAISWSDDRRAAAFVSPTNPAALWFAKFATGIVNGRLRADINRPLQYAMGLFEAERLYGLNYVLVPANDYSVKHGIKDYIDSVQFPHQTLINRGGDCSDLAILFASLMESVGIEAAFITVPGHIFAAFDTGLDEQRARQTFSDPGLLIFRGNKAWIPVEITMVKDGFLKAWRVGAKEWLDNTQSGNSAFYRLPECWSEYPSTAFPDVNPRFVLPEDAPMVSAFDATVDRYVLREIVPQVQSLEAQVAAADPSVKANELGVLYASYGLLSQSWDYFSKAAQAGHRGAWTNLGNVTFLQKNYPLALAYFQYALAQDPLDDEALLGEARCQYELENFEESDRAYRTLRARNPTLAARFGYLASIFGGEGRAFSLSERFASTQWVKDSGEIADASLPRPGILDHLPTESDKVPQPVAIPAPAAPEVAVAPEPAAAVAAPAQAPEVALGTEPPVAVPAPEPATGTSEPTVAVPSPSAAAPEPSATVVAPTVAAPEVATAPEPSETGTAPEGATGTSEPAVAVTAPGAAAPEPAAESSPPVAAAEPAVAELSPTVSQPEVAAVTSEPAVVPAPAEAPEAAPGTPQDLGPPSGEVAMIDSAPAEVAPPEAPVLPPAEWQVVSPGWRNALPTLGRWRLNDEGAQQTDPNQFFAKLLSVVPQGDSPLRYSFSARSTGKGWVGVGLHFLVAGTGTHLGYGEGRSWLVWLTRDPVHFKKNVTRLQVYHSQTDVQMKMVAEVPVSGSIFDWNKFAIRLDPAAGSLAVELNGEVLNLDVPGGLGTGDFVAFRSIDKAEFKDFLVEAKQ